MAQRKAEKGTEEGPLEMGTLYDLEDLELDDLPDDSDDDEEQEQSLTNIEWTPKNAMESIQESGKRRARHYDAARKRVSSTPQLHRYEPASKPAYGLVYVTVLYKIHDIFLFR